jgi:hypothetical protein
MAWTPDSKSTTSWSTDVETGAPYAYNQGGLAYDAAGYAYNARSTAPIWTPDTKH